MRPRGPANLRGTVNFFHKTAPCVSCGHVGLTLAPLKTGDISVCGKCDTAQLLQDAGVFRRLTDVEEQSPAVERKRHTLQAARELAKQDDKTLSAAFLMFVGRVLRGP